MTHHSEFENFEHVADQFRVQHATLNVGFTTSMSSSRMVELLEAYGEERFKTKVTELMSEIGLISDPEQIEHAVLHWLAVATPERN